MAYDPNIPDADDLISDSQPIIKANFQQLDTSFGIDHYMYSDATADNGKHKTVTTPAQATIPAVSANNPKIFGFSALPSLADQVIQFSKGGSQDIPTPLTNLHSPATPIILAPLASTPLFDFTGIARSIVYVYAANFIDNTDGAFGNVFVVGSNFWTGTGFANSFTGAAGSTSILKRNLSLTLVGNVLTLNSTNSTNTYSNIHWTLRFERIE